MNVGILGGGQLALMLSVAAKNLGLKPLCLGSSDCPAHYVSQTTEDIQKLLSHSEVLAIENEFLEDIKLPNIKSLKPDLRTIKIFSNKLEQKKLLTQLELPTADYVEKPVDISTENWIKQVQKKFPKGAVIKWGRMGYDGLGTYFLKEKNIASAIHFVDQACQRNIPLYAEDMIAFEKELAQVTACSISQKSFYHFPLVETIQASGICQSVYKFEDVNISQKARSYTEKLAYAFQGLVGTYAIEFFLKNGNLLINEIAPRVHNSGHWSYDTTFSQFEAHWRALLGQPFPKIKYPTYFGMHNILSKAQRHKEHNRKMEVDICGHLHLYWYGKKNTQQQRRRKLGHINFASNYQKEFEYLDKLAYLTSQRLGEYGFFN